MRDDKTTWLIGDTGATTSRLAVTDGQSMAAVQRFRNDDWQSLAELLSHYLEDSGQRPHSAAIAVAAPIDGDHVAMCNRDWRFNRDELRAIGFERIEVINDFHAIAYALPRFDDRSRAEIGRASRYREGNIAVLGPGSGLGMAAWIGGSSAMCGEGGHITAAPRNSEEDRIVSALREQYGHCSAERILSGPGLRDLHRVIHGVDPGSSEIITSEPDRPAHRRTLDQFFLFLAGAAADLALITGAYGGVYIAGGIVPSCIEQLRASGFRERFEDKNRYRDYMRTIPTWVITDPLPGLTGLIAYIGQLDR